MSKTNNRYGNVALGPNDDYLLSLLDSPKKIADIESETCLSTRTIRYSIRKLLDKELIKRVPDFNDLRSPFFIRNGKKGETK